MHALTNKCKCCKPKRLDYEDSWRVLRDSALETASFLSGAQHHIAHLSQKDAGILVQIAFNRWLVDWVKCKV